jgi:large subunit ribosomal protein L46
MAASSRGVGAGLRRHLTGRPSAAATATTSLCSQCLFLRAPLPSRAPVRWQSTTPTPAPADAASAASTNPATSSPPPLSQPADPSSAPTASGLPDAAVPPVVAAATHPGKRSRVPHTHVLRAGIILTRPPLLTRALTPFEEAFFFYQKRLNERLSLNFVKDVYYQKKSPARMDYMLKLRDRKGVISRELGDYRGKGAGDQWSDELMVGDRISKTEHIADVLARDAVPRISEDAELIPVEERAPPEMPLPRETEADRKQDLQRLDREMDKTLYLMVMRKNLTWEFPTVQLQSDESLHEAAQRALNETAGVNMNTWIVGHAPVAHIVKKPEFSDDTGAVETPGEKTFFIKGRIMAGQADLSENKLGYTAFSWLTRDKIKEMVPSYYKNFECMMPSR